MTAELKTPETQTGHGAGRGPGLRRRLRDSAERLSVFGLVSGLLSLAVLALILYPVISTYVKTLFPDGSFSGGPFREVFESDAFWLSLRSTVILVAISCFLAVIVGTFFAWLFERTDAGMGPVARLLPLVPMLVPPIAFSIGWVFLGQTTSGILNVLLRKLLHIQSTSGPINISSWPGLIFVYVLSLVPFSYLIVSAAFRNMDPALEDAARSFGAGLWRSFWRISFRGILPSVLSALLVAAMIGLAEYSIPSVLGTPAGIETLSVATVTAISFSYPPNIEYGVIVSFVLMLILGALWLLQRWTLTSRPQVTLTGSVASSSTVRLGRWKGPARAVVVIYVLLAAVLPVLGLLVVSTQRFWSVNLSFSHMTGSNFAMILDSGAMRQSLENSAIIGVIAATVGVLLAAILSEYSRLRGGWRRGVVEGITKLPATISLIVLGVGFAVTLGGAPFDLEGTRTILALAYIVAFLPQVTAAVSSAAVQVGAPLREAAAVAGARRLTIFRRITLPLMRRGLAGAWVFLWVLVLGDVTMAALLAGPSDPLVGLEMLETYVSGPLTGVAAFALVVTLFSAIVVGAVLFFSGLGGRGHEAKR